MRTRPVSLWIVTALLALQGGFALAAVIETAQPDRLTLQSGLLALPLAIGLLCRWSWARLVALAFVGGWFVLGLGLTALALSKPEYAAVHLFGHRVESNEPAVIGLTAALALAQAGWMWWVLRRPHVRAVFHRTAEAMEPASSVPA